MTCEHCGAPLRVDPERGMLVCDYCGSEVIPPAEDEGVVVLDDTQYVCPVCSAKLANASLEHFPMLYCRQCHGMLVAMDDLEALVSALRSHRDRPAAYVEPRNSADGGRSLRCPRCGAAMDNHPYGGAGNVNVDSCETCESVWLDKGELREIAAAPDYDATLEPREVA
ncbi:MAG TPA: zf-TFIIB domain-containing protein [Bryobacteraceae bacterium]|nr:zf-TFIIB domain-containing protein [Bryobacteraceae bacterium]